MNTQERLNHIAYQIAFNVSIGDINAARAAVDEFKAADKARLDELCHLGAAIIDRNEITQSRQSVS